MVKMCSTYQTFVLYTELMANPAEGVDGRTDKRIMNDVATNPPDGGSVEAINHEASVWMKRGIARLEAGAPAELQEAIGDFDQAIALRCKLPLDANPIFRYGLAAGWMNRGDALTRLGSAENLADAVRSYDAALETLRDLPVEANPLFRRRLAIAWSNRGLSLQAQNTAAALLEAGRSFETASAVLHGGNAAEIVDRDYLLAAAQMNHANALVRGAPGGSPAQARVMAQQAVALADQAQLQDLAMTEVRLKARYILCQAIAQLLAPLTTTDPISDDLFAEASDAVDNGLALARSWEQQGVTQFRSVAQDLFHFGARIYQMSQPHFLSEFLLENLDPARSSSSFVGDPQIHAAALESIWRSFRQIQNTGAQSPHTPPYDELLKQLRDLRLVEDRLAELQQTCRVQD
ncbi:MAG: hypothetical protein PCFJNLEI_04071 [Verrucomicrobiae bacterium]|nr:hypothetical protein [Verrucomicrobiae bacterium]